MKGRQEILIIDDDIDIQMLLKKILENSGYSVSMASDLEQGLTYLRSRVPHLVILDININQDSGFKVLQFKKQEKALEDIPVLMLSATSDTKIITKALAYGAIDYLVKPFKAAYLLNKVKRTLRNTSIASLEFPNSEDAKIQGTLRGSMVLIHELGCEIVSEAKVLDQTDIEVESKFLEELGTQGISFRTVGDAFTTESCNYKSEVHFLGVTERISQNIRKKCRS